MKYEDYYAKLEGYLTSGVVTTVDVRNCKPDLFYDVVQSVYDYLDSIPKCKLLTTTKEEARNGWIAFMEGNCENYITEP